MPIGQEAYKLLPKASPGKRKGGRKVQWDTDVYPELRGQGWLVREVYDIAMAAAKKGGNTISRVRTKRWLDSLVTKKLATMAEDGIAFVYFVK